MMTSAAWPELSYADWASTKKTLQMCSQMLGKLRLALVPAQPEWLHTSLQLTARGFTTGAMPNGDLVAAAGIDVFDSTIWVDLSDGRSARVSIGPERFVADIWADFAAALAALGIEADLWQKPQELPDTTPFSENRHDGAVDAQAAQDYHRLLCTFNGIYEEFRSEFFGRSSIQFWWGAFDFSVLLFNGAKTPPPDDRGYIMLYDLDAVHFNAGFWPGADDAPSPGFYAYLVPRPDGCEAAPIEPEHAGWVEAMGEWMMPYDAVRTCPDPHNAVLDFLRSVYHVAVTQGGWDADAHTYVKPAPSARA
jgi:hypothetical protein